MKVAIAVLSIALLGSIGLNGWLFQRGRSYYHQLNTTRLDPLGLSVYPAEKETLSNPAIAFYGDSRAAQWPAPEAPELEAFTIVNRGIGAQTTAQVLGRFQTHIAPLNPEIVVIQVGINDLKTIPLFPERRDEIVQTCKANIRQMVDLSLETGARVVVTTIFPLGEIPIERQLVWSDEVAVAIAEVNADIKTLASERVTAFDTVPILANAQGIVDAKYRRDFLHLSPAGYAALNRAIGSVLVP